jgi:hypothetical protein
VRFLLQLCVLFWGWFFYVGGVFAASIKKVSEEVFLFTAMDGGYPGNAGAITRKTLTLY